MRIILSIKSFLNYLYNNLIDLVWTKKIRFQDGTELTSANISSSSLYDIKVLAQTIAEKGWCNISNKKILTKENNPTIYNDIENKYNNANIQSSTTTINNVSSDCTYNKGNPKIIGNKCYMFKNTSLSPLIIGAYYCLLSNINDNNSWVKIFDFPNTHNGHNFANIIDCIFGNNVIVARLHYYNEEDTIFVYDYNGNFIKEFNVKEIYSANTFGEFSILDNYIYFTQKVNDKTYNYDLCKFEDLAENSIDIELVANIEYDIKNLRYAFNKYWFGYSERNSLYCAIDLDDNSTFVKKVDNCHGRFYIFDTDDMQYISTSGGNGWSKSSVDGGETFHTTTYNLPTYFSSISNQEIYQEKVNDLAMIFINGIDSNNNNKLLIFFLPYNNNSSISSDDTNIIYYGNDTYYNNDISRIAFDKSKLIYNYNYDYYYISFDKILYTDKYIINNNEINISYYKNGESETKIVLGTSQNTNIDTVTEYLGYNPYFVLDNTLNDESVQLPINTNLWTYMFVGDDYIETDFADGNSTRLLPQAEEIIDSSASVSLDVLPNKNYKFTNNAITDITLNSCQDSPIETTITFSTGNSAPTLTDNSSITWVDGATPILNANSNYIILIWNKIGFIREY